MEPLDALTALWAKIDAFFARVSTRYPGELACAAGCHDCCAPGLSVTLVEAEALRLLLEELEPERREALVARAARARPNRCVALDEKGRCGVYEARPLVCRSHGLVLRLPANGPSEPPGRRLPVIDACPKNFVGRELTEVDADCVLDQATLSTLVAAIDAAFADGHGLPRGGRVALADLLGR